MIMSPVGVMSLTAVPTLNSSSGLGLGFTIWTGPGTSTVGPGTSTVGPGTSTVFVSPGTVTVVVGPGTVMILGALRPQLPGLLASVAQPDLTVRPPAVAAADSDAFTPQRARSARPVFESGREMVRDPERPTVAALVYETWVERPLTLANARTRTLVPRGARRFTITRLALRVAAWVLSVTVTTASLPVPASATAGTATTAIAASVAAASGRTPLREWCLDIRSSVVSWGRKRIARRNYGARGPADTGFPTTRAPGFVEIPLRHGGRIAEIPTVGQEGG